MFLNCPATCRDCYCGQTTTQTTSTITTTRTVPPLFAIECSSHATVATLEFKYPMSMTMAQVEIVLGNLVRRFQTLIQEGSDTSQSLSCWTFEVDPENTILKSEGIESQYSGVVHLFSPLAASSWDRCALATAVASTDVADNITILERTAAVEACVLPNAEPSKDDVCSAPEYRVAVQVAIQLRPAIRDLALFLAGPVAISVSRVLSTVPSCTELVSMNVTHAVVHVSFTNSKRGVPIQTCAVTPNDLFALQGLVITIGQIVVQAARVWQADCSVLTDNDLAPPPTVQIPSPPPGSSDSAESSSQKATRAATIAVSVLVILILTLAIIVFAVSKRKRTQSKPKAHINTGTLGGSPQEPADKNVFGRLSTFDHEGVADDVEAFYTAAANEKGLLAIRGVDVDGQIYCLADSASMSTVSELHPTTANAFDRLEKLRVQGRAEAQQTLSKKQPEIMTLWSAPADSDIPARDPISRGNVRGIVQQMESSRGHRTSRAGDTQP